MSKILVIATSLRPKSNSDTLAMEMIRGAEEAGHKIEFVSLKNKQISFCKGCLACQKTEKCVIKDDAVEIAEKVKLADTLVFVTPIYYYEMSGQMKTLLDRLNPLFPSDYSFRKVYLLSTAAEEEAYVPNRALAGLGGWVDCFEKAELAGSLFCGGLNDSGEAEKHVKELEKAYAFGKQFQ